MALHEYLVTEVALDHVEGHSLVARRSRGSPGWASWGTNSDVSPYSYIKC